MTDHQWYIDGVHDKETMSVKPTQLNYFRHWIHQTIEETK